MVLSSPLRFLAIASVILGLETTIGAAKTADRACGRAMCVSVSVDDTNSTVTYELEALETSKQVGWMAMCAGFGRTMIRTPMVIMWPNDDGSVTLSQRNTSRYSQPKLVQSPQRVAQLTSDYPAFDQVTSPKLSFEMPSTDETSRTIIWAISSRRPAREADARLHQHDHTGILSLDLTKQLPDPNPRPSPTIVNATSEGLSAETHEAETELDMSSSIPLISNRTHSLIIAHASFVSFGFLVLLPLGSLIARWGRTFTLKWFRAHWTFNMVLGLPVIAIGWTLGALAVADQGFPHFRDSHPIGGLVLLFLYVFQLFLGRFVHASRVINRVNFHPKRNIAHVTLGISIIALAFYQARSGFTEYEEATGKDLPSAVLVLWMAWAIIIPVLYFAGLSLLKRQFTQEQMGVVKVPRHYIPYSDAVSPSSPCPSPPPPLAHRSSGPFSFYSRSNTRIAHSGLRRSEESTLLRHQFNNSMRELPRSPVAVRAPMSPPLVNRNPLIAPTIIPEAVSVA